jgi:hypothetical protein
MARKLIRTKAARERQHVQSLFDHDQPSTIIALFRVMNQYVGNLPPIVCTENLIRIYQATESAKLPR